MHPILAIAAASDDYDLPQPAPARISQAWIVTFGDLIALMLTFFVMLYTISSREPSKVDAAVSSVNEKFAISRIFSGNGLMAAKSGIVLTEQEYLDDVITTIRGRSAFGEIKTVLSGDGTLTARIERDGLFVPRTGVLTAEGREFAQEISRILLKQNSGVALRSMDIRLTAPVEEIDSATLAPVTEAPAVIRQAGSFIKELTDAGVSGKVISASVIPGEKPELLLLFYSATAPGADAAD
ncbi:MAG: flagellar motor protein MotB [Pseudomonadota bacterium]